MTHAVHAFRNSLGTALSFYMTVVSQNCSCDERRIVS